MKGETSLFILGPTLQRLLRDGVTDAERCLWRHLRGRQMDGCKFRRRHPFADYILDFVCLERRLVIELEGSGQAAMDDVRTLFLEGAGFRVLRFPNREVITHLDAVREAILAALHASEPGHRLSAHLLEREQEEWGGAELSDFPRAGKEDERRR